MLELYRKVNNKPERAEDGRPQVRLDNGDVGLVRDGLLDQSDRMVIASVTALTVEEMEPRIALAGQYRDMANQIA